MSSSVVETSPSSDSDPDPALFYELISTRKLPTHYISLSTSPSTPLYTVKAHESLTRSKADIVLHSGVSDEGPVVGVVKLHSKHARRHTIGVGNPESIIEEGGGKEGRMVWERLQRMKKWSFRTYEVEFGEGQERKVYTWRRTMDRWPRVLKDMELRVGREESGELVAVWRGSQRMKIKRGSLFVRRRMGEVEGRLEVLVLLTALAIIEAAVRRAR